MQLAVNFGQQKFIFNEKKNCLIISLIGYSLNIKLINMSSPHHDKNNASCSWWNLIQSPLGSMGWLQSVGSTKLQVSFAERSFFYRALLQKRRIILSILLTKATPSQHNATNWFSVVVLWGGYYQQALENYRSLLQNIVSFIRLFCKRDQ